MNCHTTFSTSWTIQFFLLTLKNNFYSVIFFLSATHHHHTNNRERKFLRSSFVAHHFDLIVTLRRCSEWDTFCAKNSFSIHFNRFTLWYICLFRPMDCSSCPVHVWVDRSFHFPLRIPAFWKTKRREKK